MTNVIRKIKTVVGCGLLAMLTACNGILDDIYDEPATPAAGDIYIDASDWTQWHYIDLHALKEAADISKVGSHSVFSTIDFVCDTWNQTDVWTVQDRMLQGLVGNQRIKINTELGKWLRLDIPPMPPAFTHNSNVFVVRLADGTYAAIRLKNSIGTTNRKCQLTIEYKYPI